MRRGQPDGEFIMKSCPLTNLADDGLLQVMLSGGEITGKAERKSQ